MVGVVAGAIVVVLLLLLLALYIYFFVVRRRRGPHHQKRPSLTGNGSLKRSSGVNVDIQHTHGAGSDHTDASRYGHCYSLMVMGKKCWLKNPAFSPIFTT